MNNNVVTPKQALEILTNLGKLDTLKLNLTEHLIIQNALKVIGEVIKKEEPTQPDLKDI